MPAENAFARLSDDTVVAEPTPVATDGTFTGTLTSGDTPPPPPPMPETGTPATPAPPPAMPVPADPEQPAETTTSQPSVVVASEQPAEKPQTTDGWQVDWYELRSFGDAVIRARAYLDAVQAKVDRMQGAELTPQLGTSPVGAQLAKKFDDRLNSADGLRAMLAEAMKRMEDFVTSAETAARAYEDNEESTVDKYTNQHDDPPVKNG